MVRRQIAAMQPVFAASASARTHPPNAAANAPCRPGMRGTNVRRRWWSQAVAAAQLFPRTVTDAAGEQTTVYDFKLHELRHTAASLAIQAGANIKALQNMLGHESAGLTLDRYGHLYGSDVEAVGVAINDLLTRNCGQNVGTGTDSGPTLRAVNSL
jgi:integrase